MLHAAVWWLSAPRLQRSSLIWKAISFPFTACVTIQLQLKDIWSFFTQECNGTKPNIPVGTRQTCRFPSTSSSKNFIYSWFCPVYMQHVNPHSVWTWFYWYQGEQFSESWEHLLKLYTFVFIESNMDDGKLILSTLPLQYSAGYHRWRLWENRLCQLRCSKGVNKILKHSLKESVQRCRRHWGNPGRILDRSDLKRILFNLRKIKVHSSLDSLKTKAQKSLSRNSVESSKAR